MTPCSVFAYRVLEASRTVSFSSEEIARLSTSFQRLQKFTGDKDFSVEVLKRLLSKSTVQEQGSSRTKKISMVTDSEIYDILETYELGSRLVLLSCNWSKVWQTIYDELVTNKSSDIYGTATEETVNKLRAAFDELQDCVNSCSTNHLDISTICKFEMFGRDKETNKLIYLGL